MDAKEQDQLANFLQGFAKQLREMLLHGKPVSGGNSLELGDVRLQLRFEVESLAPQTASAD